MPLTEELKRVIRELKYRTQELDSKTLNRNLDMSDFKLRISEIRSLADRLEKEV